ncbi:MAG TPA: hypothetical protein VF796_17540 [Humisphaera sp.]
MPEVWQTIEQAAVTLGLSVRTVNRHITAGKLQSRLFEGRREVLIPPAEVAASIRPPAAGAPSATGSAARPASAPQPTVAAATAVAEPEDDGQAETNAQFGAAAAAAADATFRGDNSARQKVTAEVAADKPLDLQTMLTLADSIDDKATLAVAAYQTLARSAETQVQSLRRVAFGAWAAVGVLAVGTVVGVGWGVQRLTSAESSAAHLQERVSEQSENIKQLTAEKEAARGQLAEAELRAASAESYKRAVLEEREAHQKAEQARAEQMRAEMAAFAARQATTRPTTLPANVAHTDLGPAAATQPSSDNPVSASPFTFTQVRAVTRPTTAPETKPVGSPQRPGYTNAPDLFDPR